MDWRRPSEIGGYVLAGGKSSRMGYDKALLELAGKPLALHAVVKLRRVCQEVYILSGNQKLDAFAPIIPDIHCDCGPLGGIEAGLKDSAFDWNLFMPVDMPFLPSAFLDHWIGKMMLSHRERGTRIAIFTVDGTPQPAVCLLHREVRPLVTSALEAGRYKLLPALEDAGRVLALREGFPTESVCSSTPWWSETSTFSTDLIEGDEAWLTLTEAQSAAKRLWFASMNTPEEFAEAERHLEALDT